MFFNYKNAEFFIDAIFALMTIFERFGDGVGCFIVSKILLPIFHGLNHSNYCLKKVVDADPRVSRYHK